MQNKENTEERREERRGEERGVTSTFYPTNTYRHSSNDVSRQLSRRRRHRLMASLLFSSSLVLPLGARRFLSLSLLSPFLFSLPLSSLSLSLFFSVHENLQKRIRDGDRHYAETEKIEEKK